MNDIITGLNKNAEIKIVSGLEPFMKFNTESKTLHIVHKDIKNEGDYIILVNIIDSLKR